MKLVADERLKHRLVGLAVVLSLGAIFLPSMMKKSSQRLERNFSVHVQLPSKPAIPNVVVTDKQEMFKTVKIAKVVIPPVLAETDLTTSITKIGFTPDKQVARRKPSELALNDVAKNAVKKQINKVLEKPARLVNPIKVQQKILRKPVAIKANQRYSVNNKGVYAVQLASFTKLSNAQNLISKLRGQGYKADYAKTNGKKGIIYRVYVGHSPVKSDVMKVRTQLASAMQLNGFVVNTGVS